MAAKGGKENRTGKTKGATSPGGRLSAQKVSTNGTGIRKAGSKSKLNDTVNGGKSHLRFTV